jgi:RNA polymerase sigma factor (sigma-70 family)
MAAPPNRTVLDAVKQYGGRLFGFIRDRVRTQEDAEDILQDVWYQLSRVVDLDQIGSLSGWLYEVARNRITDRYRRTRETTFTEMWLWNHVLTQVVPVRVVSFWQAAGLLLLSRLLFGSWPNAARGGRWGGGSSHWKARWQQMTDEEKARFKEKWRSRGGEA